MPKRPDRTRPVERVRAANYLKKATQFFEAMGESLQESRWDAAGLNAVHCAISACDAVLVYYTQQRSASIDHEAAVYLLNSLPKVPDAKQKAETLRRILQKKHLIEYEDRNFSAQEASDVVKLTERLFRWAQGLLGSS